MRAAVPVAVRLAPLRACLDGCAAADARVRATALGYAACHPCTAQGCCQCVGLCRVSRFERGLCEARAWGKWRATEACVDACGRCWTSAPTTRPGCGPRSGPSSACGASARTSPASRASSRCVARHVRIRRQHMGLPRVMDGGARRRREASRRSDSGGLNTSKMVKSRSKGAESLVGCVGRAMPRRALLD